MRVDRVRPVEADAWVNLVELPAPIVAIQELAIVAIRERMVVPIVVTGGRMVAPKPPFLDGATLPLALPLSLSLELELGPFAICCAAAAGRVMQLGVDGRAKNPPSVCVAC